MRHELGILSFLVVVAAFAAMCGLLVGVVFTLAAVVTGW